MLRIRRSAAVDRWKVFEGRFVMFELQPTKPETPIPQEWTPESALFPSGYGGGPDEDEDKVYEELCEEVDDACRACREDMTVDKALVALELLQKQHELEECLFHRRSTP